MPTPRDPRAGVNPLPVQFQGGRAVRTRNGMPAPRPYRNTFRESMSPAEAAVYLGSDWRPAPKRITRNRQKTAQRERDHG